MKKLVKIQTIQKSAANRNYGKTADGTKIFPADKNVVLVEGSFAIVVDVTRTSGLLPDGKLGEVAPYTRTEAMSVFTDKNAAIEAMHEDVINEIDSTSFLNNLRAKAGVFTVAEAKQNAAALVD